ncbi:hypothetical protein SAMD00019534_083180 [Acytostelium subglobosum LB1]|uniref:hypothetical protein n=1 Tax=Acytostelium subglobosum LB1 TaxID=1410327 RepID=UPI000644B695|nr:hypothetical protein SAMD00019534_083180 [Acytostelium subglobosum LB1]GAM25143.1 hypothetical protein SAMD00019534_083180 [Acytostelium subglobosum LB1]|eukprot:XP_012751663.1 hypothetical protein SAMD00019534_083180 [Acytostelium subglobosum LB1]
MSIPPLFACLFLFFVRFLFYSPRRLLPNSKKHYFFDVVKAACLLALTFAVAAFSSWQYIIVAPIVIILFIYLLVASMIHLRRLATRHNAHVNLASEGVELFEPMPGVRGVESEHDRIPLNLSGDGTIHHMDWNGRPTSLLASLRKLASLTWWRSLSGTIKDDIKTSPKTSIFLALLIVIFAIIMPLALDRICVCSHPMSVSVRFSRGTSCKHGTICFSYLTLPEDGAHSMILQYHTRDYPDNPLVRVSLNTTGDVRVIERSSLLSMSKIIKEESRWISTHFIDGLSPNTTYFLDVCYNNGSICAPQSIFSTLPDDESEVRFIVGGDIQLNKDSNDLAFHSFDYLMPHFVIVGGDIAYAEGINACYQRWDEKLAFLGRYYSNSTGFGQMIPYVFAIGNHEAGGFFQSSDDVPFYLAYAAFSREDAFKQQPRDRSTYHFHVLGNYSSLSVLDSCVVSTWAEQTQWLQSKWDSLGADRYLNRLTLYHSPIYPAGGQGLGEKIPALGQASMVPLFDRYNVSMSFENHEHMFKRSKPLRGGEVDPLGTIYVGDGAFGIGSRSKPSKTSDLPWFLEQRSQANHLWIIRIQPTITKAFAIDPDGVVFDKVDKIVEGAIPINFFTNK